MNPDSMKGEMAASLAHEIKQPITAALTNAHASLRLLQMDPLDVSELRDATMAIVQSAKRAAEIIDHVRALSRKSTPERELVTSTKSCAKACRRHVPQRTTPGARSFE